MNEFYKLNMPQVRMDVVSFYERNNLSFRDAKGIINIAVSMDGSFDHTGFNARHGCSLAIDVFTGRPVDGIMTEKCIECKLSDKYTDNGNCPQGLFHGASGDMEKFNALTLFGRSQSLGFRYVHYISDGDGDYNKGPK